jgi:hypothetical protein
MSLNKNAVAYLVDQQLSLKPLRVSANARDAAIAFIDRVKEVAASLAKQYPEQLHEAASLLLALYDEWDVPYIGGKVEAAVKKEVRPFLVRILNQTFQLQPPLSEATPALALPNSRALTIAGVVLSIVISLAAGFRGCGPVTPPAPEVKVVEPAEEVAQLVAPITALVAGRDGTPIAHFYLDFADQITASKEPLPASAFRELHEHAASDFAIRNQLDGKFPGALRCH